VETVDCQPILFFNNQKGLSLRALHSLSTTWNQSTNGRRVFHFLVVNKGRFEPPKRNFWSDGSQFQGKDYCNNPTSAAAQANTLWDAHAPHRRRVLD